MPRSSHEVAISCRVSSPRSVASHRLNASSSSLAPLRGFDPEVFRVGHSGGPKSTGNPLVKLCSPSECYQLAPLPTALAWATPSMGFGFPAASSVLGVYCSGFASPGTFRLQVFSTSYRLTPPRTLRVCFTPLTLLGFHPSETSPRNEPSASSVTRYPLGIAFLTNRCPRNLDSQAPSTST